MVGRSAHEHNAPAAEPVRRVPRPGPGPAKGVWRVRPAPRTRARRGRRCALEVPEGAALCRACITDPPPLRATPAAATHWIPLGPPHRGVRVPFGACLPARARPRDGRRLDTDLAVARPAGPRAPARARLQQAWELAPRLRRTLHCPADAGRRLRVEDAAHRLAFAADRRAAHVRGAFALDSQRSAEVPAGHLAVVDDPMTTAPTAAAIARALRAGGAVQVEVRVVARTPRSDPSR
jgi:hypothetical protein